FIFVDKAELFSDAGPRDTGQFRRFSFLASGKEHAVIRTAAKIGEQFCCALLTMVFRNWAASSAIFHVNILQTRIPFAARPVIHGIKEFPAVFTSFRRNKSTHGSAGCGDLVKQTK